MTRVQRVISIPLWTVLVGVAVVFVSPIASIYVSVKINQRTIAEAERAKDAATAATDKAAAEAKAEGLVRYCRLIGAQVDVYSGAETPVRQRAYETWLTEYNRSGCKPRR